MARLAMKLEGVDDLNKVLTELAPNQAKNLLRSTVHGIAGVAVDRIEAAAPYKHLRTGFRAIRKRGQGDARPVSEVRSTRAANDWRWAEFGTAERRQKTTGRYAGRVKATPFVFPQVEMLRKQMPAIYREQFGAKLEKQLARMAKAANK